MQEHITPVHPNAALPIDMVAYFVNNYVFLGDVRQLN